VQALTDISCLALCCRSNETRAVIGNLPNSAQLEGTPSILQVTFGSVQVWECGEGQTDTQMHVTNIHSASATPRAKCNKVTLLCEIFGIFLIHPDHWAVCLCHPVYATVNVTAVIVSNTGKYGLFHLHAELHWRMFLSE